ncbi:MAG: DUF4136 domain-containing protein [Dysgonamonadaceae bacterium]|jgi:hypothetical protein|nr:DUF4136 domain-containing protein [Dysgonamonadaceae bacterium]
MKQLFLLFSLLSVFPVYSQQSSDFVCRLGFTFEMSFKDNWGKNMPVILSVDPLSPADAAGLKVNDIVESINDVSTENKMFNEINLWLQNGSSGDLRLTVSNLSYKKKAVVLRKDCKLSNALNERNLASVYSFYSLENIQERSFICPFKTTLHSGLNLMNYKTFGFMEVDQNNRELEEVINESIRKALEKKGLIYQPDNADLIVSTYYSYDKNLNYEASPGAEKLPLASRYNMQTEKMETLPVYYHPLINQKQAKYLLNLGIRMIDRLRSSGSNLVVAWECEANEMLSSDYSINNYAVFHIPLMLMQYPYPQTLETAQFMYLSMKYNYTGLNYNIDNLKEVVDVDRYSPAYRASIKPGDEIERICGIKIENNPKTASESYKQFIYKTMPLRDVHTVYTNSSGFTQCMFWDKFKYAQIADEFKKTDNATIYSYLFYFEPYIHLSGTNILTFDIKRGKERMSVKVTPVLRLETMFGNYK